MDDFSLIRKKISDHQKERGWDKFYNPKDLLIALMSEVGELSSLYSWLNDKEMDNIHSDEDKKAKVEEEIADIFMYLITLCDIKNIDIIKILNDKVEKNIKKYPSERSAGRHNNPLEGYKASSSESDFSTT